MFAGLLILLCAFTAEIAAAATRPRPVPRSDLVRHEFQDTGLLEGWQRRERLATLPKLNPRANATASLLPMRIGFLQPDSVTDKAHQMLMDRADPESPLYGQHLSAQEVVDLFAPADDAVQAVTDWVVSSGGIPADRVSLSTNRQWLQFMARVDEAEQLLQAEFYSYEHVESGVRLAACPEYHVPASLQKHIDYITPGTKLASLGFHERVEAASLARRDRANKKVQLKSAESRDPAPWETGGCDETTTFECIRSQYGLPDPSTTATATPVAGNEVGIFESLGEHYTPSDLDIFFSWVAPELPRAYVPELRAINGATGAATKATAGRGLEANMDLEIVMPLVYPQKTVLWQVDDEYYELAVQRSGSGYSGVFNTFFDAIDGSYCTSSSFGYTGNCADAACRDPEYPDTHSGTASDGTPLSTYQGQLMCGTFKPTNVIGFSYGNVETLFPANYLRRQCNEIMKLALQGVTVVVSSGDVGVGGKGSSSSQPTCLGSSGKVFQPRLIATCPYVLSVGATIFQKPQNTANAANQKSKAAYVETAPSGFATGGGFSNVFPTPDYQKAAVADYLAHANLSFTGYNGDVSGDAVFNRSGRAYPDVAAVGDKMWAVYQSGATQIAGTSASSPIWSAVITLINEARLKAKKSTVGWVNPTLYKHPEAFTDIIEGSNPGCGSSGFVATSGWDPVTGLGTPNFPKLRDLFLSLA